MRKLMIVGLSISGLGSLGVAARIQQHSTVNAQPDTLQQALPIQISTISDPTKNAAYARMLHLGDGRLQLVWSERVHGTWQVKTKTFNSRTLEKGPVVDVSASRAGHDALYPTAALGKNGQLMFAWVEGGSPRYSIKNLRDVNMMDENLPDNLIYARLYSPDSGWGTPKLLNRTSGDSYNIFLLYNTPLDAFQIVWGQWDGWADRVFYSDFKASRGWSQGMIIDAGRIDSYATDFTVNSRGDALVAWYAADTSEGDVVDSVYFNLKILHNDWQGAKRVNTNFDHLNYASVIARGSQDFLLSFWRHNRFDYQGRPERILIRAGSIVNESEAFIPYDANLLGSDMQNPMLSLKSAGELAGFSWVQIFKKIPRIMVSLQDGDEKWQDPVVLSSGGDNPENPSICLNSKGSALVVWSQQEEGLARIVASSYHSQAKRWTRPFMINWDASRARQEQVLRGALPPYKTSGQLSSCSLDDHNKANVLWTQSYDGVLQFKLASFSLDSTEAR
ncbi:hypothetical protein [Oligoflexus tunisiensis]|uniref:hypothetical protein n=1 Tax=Oligoflexus tunisiensis TaxID=708132 RepID=UPI00114CDFF7|nr:hypothetical protein [Oligoflexus tunisiensis]